MPSIPVLRRTTLVTLMLLPVGQANAQGPPVNAPTPAAKTPVTAATAASAPIASSDRYVIGPEDVIGVLFWREAEMSGDITVRPDGRITLPLLGDIDAAGYSPEELKARIEAAAGKYMTEPNVTIVVRQLNSRKVFITGQVQAAGAHPLVGPRTVTQVIALAGGLTEYADAEKITVMRQRPDGRSEAFRFNYNEVASGKKLEQNILLQPGDTIVVP